jgi:hypothetical protein
MELSHQLFYLFILAIPVACIAWTVTHEEVFREPREFCVEKSKTCKSIFSRKFFYLFTCEYCFSFYVTALIVWITDFTLLYSGWKGYVIAGFSIIWIANIYMSLFFAIRIDIKKKGTEAKVEEKVLQERSNEG